MISSSQTPTTPEARLIPIGEGYARTSVNAVVFRASSVVSHGQIQYAAYYDPDGRVILAKRRHGSLEWEMKPTQYEGNVTDAHNSISLGIDGRGILHVAWDHHNHPLRYAQTTEPGSLELSDKLAMTGQNERRVAYPQFYTQPKGDMFFLYRDGESGNGNMMLNHYDPDTGKWQALHHPLIAGEDARNAYTNHMAVDGEGGLHLSWVWRDFPDVSSNNDICYACSGDGGRTWRSSSGQPYVLPITKEAAEVAWPVPQRSELMNQTSMTTDRNGRPIIVSYWREQDDAAPQYRVVWHDGVQWRMNKVGHRHLDFRLSGAGTKRIPISRPQVVAGNAGEIFVIFRDEERGNGVSVAISRDAEHASWQVIGLLPASVGAWEPTYDPVRWALHQQLDIFVQRVGQGDGETTEDLPPQMVSILEWKPWL